MNNKEQFVTKYYPYAIKASEKTGIPVVFALAQSALESGWGKYAKGNMMFGIKKGSGINYGGWSRGDTQLITTTEYSSVPTRSFPFIYPGYPVQTSSGKWKYKIKDVFRAYPSPFFSFMDWAGLLFRNKRYRNATANRNNPFRFADEVAKAGYATDPNYASKIKSIMREIDQIIRQKGLNQKRVAGLLPIVGTGVSMFIIVAVIVFINQKKAI